jgi:hypothetical protein
MFGSHPELDPELFAGQVGTGSRSGSKTQRKMRSGSGYGSKINSFGSTTLLRTQMSTYPAQRIPSQRLVIEKELRLGTQEHHPTGCIDLPSYAVIL